MKKLILLAGLILFLGCVDQGRLVDLGELPFKEEVSQVSEESMEAGVTSLDFESHNGFIDVQFWDNDEYKVEVEKWARGSTSAEAQERVEGLQVAVSQSGETLKVEVEDVRYTGANVKAYIPRKSFDTVYLSTSNGHVEMEEVTASNVTLKTSNGHIEAYVTADDIRVKTSNGTIKGFFQGDEVNLDTSNGEITIECGDGGEYSVDTSNARVNITAGLRGEFEISTSNGSINVTVAGDFDFDLRTSNASIQVAADEVTYTVDSRTHKKGSTAEEPEVSITASTSNASITVTKK